MVKFPSGESFSWTTKSPLPSILRLPSNSLSNSGTRSSASEKRNVSESKPSWYCGNSLSVLRLIEARLRLQPSPKTPLPLPDFFYNVTPTTEIYTLSLHDALANQRRAHHG